MGRGVRAGPWRRTHAVGRGVTALAIALTGLVGLGAGPAGAAANPAFSSFDIPGQPNPPGSPVVALTFDDGPSPQITPGILDTLAAHGAVATFFVVGQWAASNPDLVRRAIALGNSVELHTMTHRDLSKSTPAQIAAEVDPEVPLIQALTGRTPTCLRPPYGAWNATVVSTLAARGIETVMWSVNPGDTESGATAGSITTRALAGARPGAIIALHDSGTKQATLAALPGILDGLRARGLTPVTMCGGAPAGPATVDLAVRADGAGYTLDADGGLHAFGGAPAASGPSIPHLARRVILRPDGISGYVLDGYGALHPFGGAPTVSATGYWPGWDIARAAALRPDGASGWVLDGLGGLHPFGGAPAIPSGTSWPSWDIARGLAATSDGAGGYVLDGLGGLHPFGTAVPVANTAYRAGADHARGLTLGFDDRSGWVLDQTGALLRFGAAAPGRPSRVWLADAARGIGQAADGLSGAVVDRTGTVARFTAGPATRAIGLRADGVSGYELSASGHLRAFGGAPTATGAPSWPGWDIARDVAVRGDGAGYVLDGLGGLHPFNGAPAVGDISSYRSDLARAVALRADGVSGYTLDAYGGLHPFGGAPARSTDAYWPGWDIARGIALRPDGVSGYTLDGFGGIHPFGGAPAVAAGTYWPGWDIARGIALRADGVSGWVLDGWGGVHPFGGAPAVAAPVHPGRPVVDDLTPNPAGSDHPAVVDVYGHWSVL